MSLRLGRRRVGGPPRVSVVINTLNRRDQLRETLLSLSDQRYTEFEVVVVDGPSTDGTSQLLASWPHVRALSCPVANLGVSRNIGLDASAGEILAFIDDDATPGPEWICTLVDRLVLDRGLGAVGGDVFDVPLQRIEWKLCTCDRLGRPCTDSEPPIEKYTKPGAERFVYLAGCNMAFRRSVLELVGGFNRMLAYGYDDVDVCCRLVDAGIGIAVESAPSAVVHHHRAPSSVRDVQLRIRDPYDFVFSRAVFALQNRTTATRAEVESVLIEWANDWANVAATYTALTDVERSFVVDRARAGIAAGLDAGLVDRPFHVVQDLDERRFRRFQRLNDTALRFDRRRLRSSEDRRIDD